MAAPVSVLQVAKNTRSEAYRPPDHPFRSWPKFLPDPEVLETLGKFCGEERTKHEYRNYVNARNKLLASNIAVGLLRESALSEGRVRVVVYWALETDKRYLAEDDPIQALAAGFGFRTSLVTKPTSQRTSRIYYRITEDKGSLSSIERLGTIANRVLRLVEEVNKHLASLGMEVSQQPILKPAEIQPPSLDYEDLQDTGIRRRAAVGL